MEAIVVGLAGAAGFLFLVMFLPPWIARRRDRRDDRDRVRD